MKIKVLHVISSFGFGGIETFLLNVIHKYNLTNKSIEISVAITDKFVGKNIEALKKTGIRIIYFTTKGSRPTLIEYYKNFKEINTGRDKFDAIHSHSYFFSGVILFFAFITGFKKRIAHSHDTFKGQKYTYARMIYEFIARIFISIFSTDLIACSISAGEFLFGKNHKKQVFIINNGIFSEKFKFNLKTRDIIRKSFRIDDDCFVIGHSGRFAKQKNHSFIIDIFKSFLSLKPNSKLVLLGDGPLLEDIKLRVNQENLTNKIYFTGAVDNVHDYLNSFDVFIFPSIYEGLGISFIEAQFNSLYCFVSNIPSLHEAQFSSFTKFINLNSSSKSWALEIFGLFKTGIFERSNQNLSSIDSNKFDIETTVKQLTKIYLGNYDY